MAVDRTETQAWNWDTALQGIIPPMISPLSETGEVDGGALERLVAHILDGGCSGLFILGGCGEGAWLTSKQRASVVRASHRAASGKAPILVGVMLPAMGLAVEAARRAADEGADALVVGSPYYYPAPAAVQRRHVEGILGAVALPILLYNIPQATHQPLAPATVAALASNSRVLGIKDSAGDFETFQHFLAIKRTRANFRVLQGHEAYAAASLLLGGDGLVPGMANFAPDLFVELRRAAARGDAATCARLQATITDLETLHAQTHWLPALKAACAICGLGNGVPTPPLAPATIEERRAVEAILARHGFPRPR
jgi:dihydrodipicolinate synthase/N-acetylneuraminate lyase